MNSAVCTEISFLIVTFLFGVTLPLALGRTPTTGPQVRTEFYFVDSIFQMRITH